jgi:hypothetical protein
MPSYIPSTSPVFTRFVAPLIAAYKLSERQYNCTELTDLDFLEMGVVRVLSDSKTGRDFVQRHADHGRKEVSVDLFFKAMKSTRRLTNATSVNRALDPLMSAKCDDPFLAIEELDNFAIYAGDGHYHGAAAHDKRLVSNRGELKKYPTGHFFMLDLRTHYMRHIATAEQGGTRKSEHDMRVIKRTAVDTLRGGQPKGRKVIMAWDPAGIDFVYWQKVKRSYGLYFISREKQNMSFTVVSERAFDADAAENTGIISDEIVVPSGGVGKFRRVTYVDTTDGTVYTYITTEMTLPPWVIVLIYKHRWDIEKVFDEFKSKLYERKSWASGKTAKTAHAQFLCLVHNLMVLLEDLIVRESGVENEKEVDRKQTRKDSALQRGASFIATALQRFTVRPLKFIRWLRNFTYCEASWSHAIERLRRNFAIF